MTVYAESMHRDLQYLKELRGSKEENPERLTELKHWQSRRLAATYADIAAQPRYRAATDFFLSDLYGPKDFSARDKEMLRILPVMMRMLPASAVETAALAIELEALSEDLDHRLAKVLPAGPIDGDRYARAYRESSPRAKRERQIELIGEVGHRLDALTTKPFVFRTLKLMRRPAQLAGLADLQEFLERGFDSFREMHGADGFLALVQERETALLERLFSGGSISS